MLTKDIYNKIDEVKAALRQLDSDYDKTIDHFTNTEEEYNEYSIKLSEIMNIQDDQYTFNLNGHLIQIYKGLFTKNTIYSNNILNKIAQKYLENPDNIKLDMITIDNNCFQACLDLLRMKSNTSCFNYGEQTIEYAIPKTVDFQVFLVDIRNFFLEDTDKVLSEVHLLYYNKSYKTYETLTCVDDYQIQSFDNAGIWENKVPSYCVAQNIEDIFTPTSKVAFFIKPESYISFTFRNPLQINKIRVRPFYGCKEMWHPGDGAGSQIFITNNADYEKLKWEYVGKLPGNYGLKNEKRGYCIDLENGSNVYGLKFQAGLFGLSISYLHFN